ncbi:hypothetical protein CYMTET_18861 [Cymbomonas tetramitiformis]|uniref:Uncharacterized protein n=1 Tax=Cymbomonas tetramitiformis TaxID=36881 RepID=A0AAE0G792_9CHLO|nr:hypothetical protein CYMTET_18861 [Cymbomonas tetramitiformis]
MNSFFDLEPVVSSPPRSSNIIRALAETSSGSGEEPGSEGEPEPAAAEDEAESEEEYMEKGSEEYPTSPGPHYTGAKEDDREKFITDLSDATADQGRIRRGR